MHERFDAEPFRVAVPQAELEDLRQRLARTRWPIEPRDAREPAAVLFNTLKAV
jgi:hypothetical protein